MQLRFSPMDERGAETMIDWRYPPPYDIYHIAPSPTERPEVVRFLVDRQNAYYRIDDERGELVAFCCFGADAQVPGGDYTASALDIGMGVRPDLTGRGLGLTFATAVIDYARASFAPRACRVSVAAFNRRAIRVWEKAGFQAAQFFKATYDGAAFVILVLPLS